MTQPSTPSLPELAEVLAVDQGALLDSSAGPGLLPQTGAVVLPEAFPVPVPEPDDPVHPGSGSPVIETFVVEADGRCRPTGPVEAIGRWWQATAQALVDRVHAALAGHRVGLEYPAYLTASATALDEVTTTPHVDDGGIDPARGVGLVAIAASHAGPRLALGPLAHRPVRPPAPLAIEPDAVEAFATGFGPSQSTPADRIVLFPRFGQLHAGPMLDDLPPGGVRNLLVLRAGTRPSVTRRG